MCSQYLHLVIAGSVGYCQIQPRPGERGAEGGGEEAVVPGLPGPLVTRHHVTPCDYLCNVNVNC